MTTTEAAPPVEETIARFGSWTAFYDNQARGHFVRDSRSGLVFGANSRAHAIKKAQDHARRDAPPA